jgi:hypothetical protein
MRKWIIAIFVVALVFALAGLRTTLSSPQDKPKKVIPPPPKEIMDEVIKNIGIPIPRIEDVPEEMRNPKIIPTKADPRDVIRRKIYETGELPQEWDNLSDREVEIEIFKLTLDVPYGAPYDWESLILPKFYPAPEGTEGNDTWHVEFNKSVKKKDYHAEVDRIIQTYGGTIKFKREDSVLRRSVFIVTDPGRARSISEDPMVRRVEQDFVDKRPGSFLRFGEFHGPLRTTKPKDQK